MKKIIPCLFFLAIASFGFSQSQRLVMFEEFTQASCGPCGQDNPAFDALLSQDSTMCTSIRYHTSWPGVDPMNAQNPTDVAVRVSYYGVSYVPYVVMDGTGEGVPPYVTQAMITAEYAVPSPFTLSIRQQLSAGQDTIYFTMLGVCTDSTSGSLVAQNGVIEKHIHFNTPPGSNGETDFYNVMKKMVPTANGTVLQTSFQSGDYFIVQGSWKLANVYSISELAVVGFIQNNTNKDILQSANSDTNALTMPYNDDVQLMAATNYSPTNCSGSVAPIITIRNNGNYTVTSMTINYTVNNGTLATYTWNGNLMTLQQTVITLPAYIFSPQSSNTLLIYADKVNGVNDQYPKNDTITAVITGAPVTTNYALLYLHTDNLPQDITWNLKNSSGTIVDAGGPYSLPNHSYIDTVHLNGGGCYTFTVYDSDGEGICCYNGNGGYELVSSTGSVMRQGGSFGYSDPTEIKQNWPAEVDQLQKISMKVYPNPFRDEAKVAFNLINPEDVVLYLYNSTGQLVRTYYKGSFSSGNQECSIDASNLPSGIYMLKMQAGSDVAISKISVSN